MTLAARQPDRRDGSEIADVSGTHRGESRILIAVAFHEQGSIHLEYASAMHPKKPISSSTLLNV
jgi:hypothetical protein